MPSARIGDVVMYTSHIAEPSVTEPWYAPAGSKFVTPPTPKYRQTCAIVVGVNTDNSLDLQVFGRSPNGVFYRNFVTYSADAQQPGTWRPRS